MSCEICYAASEWKLIYCLIKKKKPPEKPPSIMQITRYLAQLGGYTNRRKDKPPGIKTLWIGLSKLYQSTATMAAIKLIGND